MSHALTCFKIIEGNSFSTRGVSAFVTGLVVQGDWSPILNVFFCLNLFFFGIRDDFQSALCCLSTCSREMRIDVIRSEPHTLSLKHFKFVSTDSLILSSVMRKNEA